MRRAAAETARIDALLRVYAAKDPPGPQTVKAYAQAAGVEWHVAQRRLRALGIPVMSQSPTPPKPSEAAGPVSDPPPETNPSPPQSSPRSQPELVAEIRRAVEQAIAPTRSLPAAVGEEVRKVTGQIAAVQGKSSKEIADERALKQISKETEAWVVSRASEMHTWMEQTGETVYKFWNDKGLRSTFPNGPGQMLETALEFYWQQGASGKVADLWDMIDDLRAERDDLARRVFELTNYRNVYDHQFQLAIEPMARAFVLGLPVSQELADTVLRVAQELADRRARSSPPLIVKLRDEV